MRTDMTNVKETVIGLFTGDVTLRKRELWMLGALCLFAGIVIGFVKAPWTHGVTIGSNNGNNSGNSKGCGMDGEECECIGACDCE